MNRYKLLKDEIEKKYNAFPFICAFTNARLNEELQKRNITDKDLLIVACGCFIEKRHKADFIALQEWAKNERKKAISEDSDGTGYIKDMFSYELRNQEYGYTYNLDDTLHALNITREDIKKDARLEKGLKLALAKYKD